MNRSIPALLVAATILTAGATPAWAPHYYTWDGLGVVRAPTTECTDSYMNIEAGRYLHVLYRPAGLGLNGKQASILMSSELAATDVPPAASDGRSFVSGRFLMNGPLTSAFQGARVSEVNASAMLALMSASYNARVRVLSQTPDTITARTKFATIELQIRNFGNVDGCSMNIIAVLIG